MPTLKEYNVKLARLRSTHKMTKTMKMVAANKLRKAQEACRKATEYADRMNRVVRRVASDNDLLDHPLFKPAAQGGGALILVVTSDRGLCGGFNNNLNKKVLKWLSSHKAAVVCCGRKGFIYLKSRVSVQKLHEGMSARPAPADAMKVGGEVLKAFLDGEAGEVYLAYNVSTSSMSHQPTIERILPVERPKAVAGPEESLQAWLVEPKPSEFLDALMPRYVNMKVFYALASNAMGEHGARMSAMENATRNAENLISLTSLLRNRARQTKITTELSEIVAGAEAQK